MVTALWLDMLSQKLISEMHRFYPNLLLHKSLNQCDNVQVSIVSMNNHLIVLKLNIWIWKPTNFPAPRKHTYRTFTTVLKLQWGVSYNKLFLCAVWHITSASHPTHCEIISLSLPRWVVPWRQTAEMNLHNRLPPSQFLWKWGPCSQVKQT